MITRVEINGFKSFRQFALDLEPLTVVIGPNSAGKSNFFDALQLLSLLPHDSLPELMGRGRGRILDQFAMTPTGLVGKISFALEMLLPDSIRDLAGRWPAWQVPTTRVRYEVDIERNSTASGREEVRITRERITPLTSDDAWAALHPQMRSLCRYALPDSEGRGEFAVTQQADGAATYEMRLSGGPSGEPSYHSRVVHFDSPRSVLSLPMFDSSAPVRIAAAVARQLGAMRFLHMDTIKLRQPTERAAVESLTYEGANLPTMLSALQPAVCARIRADLCALVPGVKNFDVVRVDDEFQLDVEFTDGQRIPARLLSDGTLRILAFLATLHAAPTFDYTVLGLEEPENGIFPGRLRAFVSKLCDITDETEEAGPIQILLNSHSPAILAALHARPRSVVFADLVRQPDGRRWTRMRPLRGGEDRPAGGNVAVSPREIAEILDSARPEEAA